MIRLATPEDAPALHAIYAPIVAGTAISFELAPPSVAEMADRIRGSIPTYPWLATEQDGRILGYAYAGPHRARPAYRWSVDVSVYVAEAGRRQGIGRALYERLFVLLRRQGYHAAFAGIALPNPASVALHEAVGFVPLGVYRDVGFKHGAWHDVGWWQRPIGDRPAHPAEPRPVTEVLD
ncbi:N-acetyltransferase [Mycobacterium sp. KBS0706]|uniref:arsinothricin resistance N-acetyltransferase ArsN1 family B n=1 Tax=Mycobacterium sp. KBS0706 TaxID=2578109 RepID=UPI00110FCD83|nr:arsinothricin resistance N-acetyltransferase ArsN1 family B [Mycobacterium sp. KBS0706]TSD84285.1 N-acetyltransferase [Mycobacterium sp. KBS0706]